LFLRAVESCLRAHSPGSSPAARLGAVAFIHRFGSSLNAHLHFHCVVIDGVFDAAIAGGIVLHAATGIDANAVAQVHAQVRQRLLHVFVRRGLLPGDDAQAMGQWEHGGGFSVDGSVRIAAADRAGRERLLRYCARPPFALERLRELDPARLLYESTKPGPGGNASLLLTPLQLLDRLAALVPPPRIHRHRTFGVLAPNSPLRAAITALAPAAAPTPPAPPPTTEPAQRRAARYAWARASAPGHGKRHQSQGHLPRGSGACCRDPRRGTSRPWRFSATLIRSKDRADARLFLRSPVTEARFLART
jgi:hypothetical protein